MIKMEFTNPVYSFISAGNPISTDMANAAGPEAYKCLSEIDKHAATAIKSRRNVIDSWHEYGTILNGMRVHLKKDNYFGDWIKANKLDTGKASSSNSRIAAMWIARVWSKGLREWLDAHEDDGYPMSPTGLRDRIRNEGHEWALDGRNTDDDARYTYKCTSIPAPADLPSEPTEPSAKKATKQLAKAVQRATQAKIDRVYSKLTKVEDEVIALSREIEEAADARAYISSIELMIERLTEMLNSVKNGTQIRRVA
jgi:hypothetical protein